MHRRYHTDPFTDLLFNALLGFTFLFMVAIVFINPLAKKANAKLKAEFIITLTWPDDQPDDLDLWVEDPLGGRVSYLQRDVGWLHLDRDDRGDINDTIEINGEKIIHPVNQEVVTLRGIVAGEYIVNAYVYAANSGQPVPVTVQVDKVNPEFKTVFIDRVVLREAYEERTLVRFSLSADGTVGEVNRLQKTLTPYALDG